MKSRSRLVIISLILLFVIAHFTFRSSRDSDGKTSFVEDVVATIYHPVVYVFSGGAGFFTGLVDDYLLLVNAKKENKALLKAMKLLRMQVGSLQVSLGRVKEAELDLVNYSYLGHTLKPVDVVGHDPFSPSKTMWINAGKIHGVTINTVVLSGDGLAGRVIKVFDKTSQVLLVIDGMYAVDVVNERTKMRCMVKGLNSGTLKGERLPFLTQVEYKQQGHEILKDDVLVTSGLSGIYPKGIPVGTVVDVDLGQKGYFEKSLVMPAVDFMKTPNLYLLTKDVAVPAEKKSKKKSKKGKG